MKTKIASLFILAGVLIAACSSADAQATEATVIPTVIADDTLIAEGRVEPVQYAEIAFTASGIVSEVLVDEGQQVKKGQPLVHLGGESDTAYTAAQLELVSAQQALDDLLNSSGTDLAQVVIDLKDSQEAYDKADDYLLYLQNSKKVPQTETRTFLIQTARGYEYRTNTKHFKGPAPEDWIIEAENDLALKKAAFEEAQRAYERMKGGADTNQLAVLEARVNAAKAGVAAFAVIAPFDGVVAKLNAKTGNSINAGEIAVTIADFSTWLIKTTDLTELDVVTIEQGQAATITLDAIPDATLNGKIESISQTFEEKQGDVVYEVTVALTDGHPDLRWGMTAIVKFEK
jgi:multidrug resistance efflux pump